MGLTAWEIELGQNIRQIMNNQLSSYYQNVIFSESRSTEENAVIKITHLSGSIDLRDGSISVNMKLELFLPGAINPIRREIYGSGKGDAIELIKGGGVAFLSKSEREALQEVSVQFVSVIELAYKTNKKVIPPRNAKKNRNKVASNKAPETIKSSHKTAGLPVIKKKPTPRGPAEMEAPQVQSDRIVSGQYYALVIGNNNYRHISKLKTAKKDAQDVARILKKKYGFQVKLLLNATRKNIEDFARQWRE